jgi:hypothetical protein
MLGYIYGIVDNQTKRIVKIGSTIKRPSRRFSQTDYRTKFVNHSVVTLRVMRSGGLDWYEKGNPDSPFLWHLIAAETLAIFHYGTFLKDKYSNLAIPLLQKLGGFDGARGGLIGGKIGGKAAAKVNMASGQFREFQRRGRQSHNIGHWARASGHASKLGKSGLGTKAQGHAVLSERGKRVGQLAIASGQLTRIQQAPPTIKQTETRSNQGRKMRDSGALAAAQESEERRNAYREWAQSPGGRAVLYKNGKNQGRQNVENGHWASLQTHEIRVMAAKASGKRAVESGQIYRICTREASIRGGKTQGKKAVESGQWERVRDLGLHTRWHVNRGLVSPICSLCGTV